MKTINRWPNSAMALHDTASLYRVLARYLVDEAKAERAVMIASEYDAEGKTTAFNNELLAALRAYTADDPEMVVILNYGSIIVEDTSFGDLDPFAASPDEDASEE